MKLKIRWSINHLVVLLFLDFLLDSFLILQFYFLLGLILTISTRDFELYHIFKRYKSSNFPSIKIDFDCLCHSVTASNSITAFTSACSSNPLLSKFETQTHILFEWSRYRTVHTWRFFYSFLDKHFELKIFPWISVLWHEIASSDFLCHPEILGSLLGYQDKLSLRWRRYKSFMHDNSTYWGIFRISILSCPFLVDSRYMHYHLAHPICTTRIKVCWVYPRRMSHTQGLPLVYHVFPEP